jgi:hypothetical protein
MGVSQKPRLSTLSHGCMTWTIWGDRSCQEHASTVRDPTAYVLAGIKSLSCTDGARNPVVFN